jgi:hypothetical protein
MTRIYREPGAGLTFVERGAGGGGVIIVPDHGGPGDVIFRFRPVDESDAATLVHDDDAPRTVSAEYAADTADQVSQILDALREAIGAARIPATAKADLRDAITRATGATS